MEELLGFEPSGVGEHCLVWVEKRDLDSNTAGARPELEVMSRFPELTAGLESAGLRQERRVMRLRPINPEFVIFWKAVICN